MRKTAKGMTSAALAGAALLALTGTAHASLDAPYIGSGYSTNTHAVWCVQHDINYYLTHGAHVTNKIAALAEDGVWGAKTEAGVRWFQGQLSETPDGVVGALTGSDLLMEGDPYYNGSPTAPGYCDQYIPGIWAP
ncbi:peptidoglycan-binding protein [Peterkaempfera sp. SMS 1(5)a]|uniref:peptidoglycan-binding domain-containing protein n=1 Tax=Peterkaempfera podocarpi TaxID=3232308 RepID=UPI00366F68BB